MRTKKFRHLMKNCFLKDDTANDSELRTVYNHPIYPRGSKIYSDKGFVNIDNGEQGRSLFLSKITNPFTLIVLVVIQINFY